MRTARAVGHDHPHPVHGHGAMGHGRRPLRAPRAIAPEALSLFSDRLDDVRDYESTMRDFVAVHDRTLSADDYNS
ncbi:MAG TPA: hypothetical protein VLC73_04275 [Burkholderiales bacterium]|nr:hypothetical protein [Burkholderiales bacterium]